MILGAFTRCPHRAVLAKLQAATSGAFSKAEGLRADVATLLASTSGLRGAIILREILGPPRGLRTLEFIGT
jgi:hypothetical protein